jgi:hypothetical protein
MNKVESIIKEELGKTLIDLAVREIKGWAKKELNYLRYALNVPVVIPVSNQHYVIDEYTIHIKDDHNHIVKKEGNLIHNFLNKKAAIIYIVLEKTRNYSIAQELMERDKTAGKMHNELMFYSSKLTSKTPHDTFQRELWISRYLESKAQYNQAKRELEKSISNAKYMKIWDKIL